MSEFISPGRNRKHNSNNDRNPLICNKTEKLGIYLILQLQNLILFEADWNIVMRLAEDRFLVFHSVDGG